MPREDDSMYGRERTGSRWPDHRREDEGWRDRDSWSGREEESRKGREDYPGSYRGQSAYGEHGEEHGRRAWSGREQFSGGRERFEGGWGRGEDYGPREGMHYGRGSGYGWGRGERRDRGYSGGGYVPGVQGLRDEWQRESGGRYGGEGGREFERESSGSPRDQGREFGEEWRREATRGFRDEFGGGWGGRRDELERGRDEFERGREDFERSSWRGSSGMPGTTSWQEPPRREGFPGGQGRTGTYGREGGLGGWQQWRPGDRPEGTYAGRGPRGYQRSDTRIREDVSDRLTDHPHVDASDVEVEVRECEVTLRGHVDDREQKRIAEDIAESVPGVKEVHNQLRVQRRDRGEERWTAPASTTMGSTGSTAGSTMGPGAMGAATSLGGGTQVRSQLRSGMEVIGSDGDRIGSIKEIRDQDFLCDRPMKRDFYVPLGAVREVQGDRAVLQHRADQVDELNWEQPALMGGGGNERER